MAAVSLVGALMLPHGVGREAAARVSGAVVFHRPGYAARLHEVQVGSGVSRCGVCVCAVYLFKVESQARLCDRMLTSVACRQRRGFV